MFKFFKDNKITQQPQTITEEVEVKVENPAGTILKYLREDKLGDLESFLNEHKKQVREEVLPEQIISEIKTYILERLIDIEKDDDAPFNKIPRLDKMHLIKLEKFKESEDIQKAAEHAIEICANNNNPDFSNRIKILPFYNYKEVA